MEDNTQNVKKAIELFNGIKPFLLSISGKEFGSDGNDKMVGKACIILVYYDKMIQYLMSVCEGKGDDFYIEDFTNDQLLKFIGLVGDLDYFIKRPVENFDDLHDKVFPFFNPDTKEWNEVKLDEIKTITAYNFNDLNGLRFSKYDMINDK